jgi:hypothetical protein
VVFVKRAVFALLLLVASARAQEAPPSDPNDVINTLLGGLLGFRDLTGPELQKEVAEVGGVPFRSDVPVDFMTRPELARYLKALFDAEYPEARAHVDQRILVALDLLPADTDLRGLRARILEENIAGFYDERPGKKRLYAISDDRRFSPANQLILSHELRHALQDQYVDVHHSLPDSVGDYDDRRLAWLSLLEGDATWVMERFLLRRLPGGEEAEEALGSVALPTPSVPGAPPVVRDQLVLPYLVGREFARALWKRGGAEALKEAWRHPPESTEQVLHPEKYFSHELPRPVEVSYVPPGGKLLGEGVLGELLMRTLLGEGEEANAAGWGGDRYRAWDLAGRTLLVWRSVWDSGEAARAFLAALRARFEHTHGVPAREEGYAVYGRGPWRFAIAERAGGVLFLSSDDPKALREALHGMAAAP